jgi:outer membrane protein insertion porin family
VRRSAALVLGVALTALLAPAAAQAQAARPDKSGPPPAAKPGDATPPTPPPAGAQPPAHPSPAARPGDATPPTPPPAGALPPAQPSPAAKAPPKPRPAGAAARPVPRPAEPSDPTRPTIVRIQIQGNKRVEAEAIRLNLTSRVDEPFSADKIRADIKAVYAMGLFDDVQVDLTETAGGAVLTYIVQEKPAIRKILVVGHDDVDLEDIQKVVNLKPFSILNVNEVKRNVEKVKDLYTEKGFYLAEIDYQLVPRPLNEVDVLIKIEEHAKVLIKRIRFVGNNKVKDEQITEKMQTKEGGFLSFITSSGTFKSEQFEKDLGLLAFVYHDLGYANVKVGRPILTLTPDRRFMEITIPVEEGDQFTVGTVDFRGELLTKKDLLHRLLGIKTGEIFNRTRLVEGIHKHLTNFYRDKGYAYANILPLTQIDLKKKTVELVVDIRPGKPVIVERITVSGNSKTRDKVVRRELKIAEGDLYSATRIELSKRRVMALGFFETVNTSEKRGSGDDKITINFEVKERPTGTFQIGAGFSSIENFIATAQIAQQNLFGRGQTLSLLAQLSSLRQLFRIQFYEPRFLDSDWIFSITGFNFEQDFFDFIRSSWGGNVLLGYYLHDDVYISAAYNIEQVAVTIGGFRGRVQNVPLANLFDAGRTSSIRLSIAWDTRNNRLFPTKGWLHSYSVQVAENFLGSQIPFIRHSISSRWYFPLFWNFVFKTNAEFGLITTSRPQGVPIFERFFLGGILSVRGFPPLSLGPKLRVAQSYDPAAGLVDFNMGGNKQLFFNFELEFPIFQKVGILGVVFYDIGNAFDDRESINFTQMRSSVGFGFRWYSPVGPLRFEWGIPLRTLPGEEPIVFEFTIGNFF